MIVNNTMILIVTVFLLTVMVIVIVGVVVVIVNNSNSRFIIDVIPVVKDIISRDIRNNIAIVILFQR